MNLLDEYLKRGYKIGKNFSIGKGSRIEGKDVIIGDDVKIGANTVIAGEKIIIGSGNQIGESCDIRSMNLKIEEGCIFNQKVKVLVSDEFRLGFKSIIGENSTISCVKCDIGRQLFVVHSLEIGGGGEREPWAELKIGDFVFIGGNVLINVNQPVSIGNRVGIGPHVSIWTHGYHYLGFSSSYEPVSIGDKAWLTSNIVISPGVKIGEKAIIASGAVVNKDIPDNKFAAGVPAKVKKDATFPLIQENVNNYIIDILSRKYLPIIRSKGYNAEIGFDNSNFGFLMILKKEEQIVKLYYKYELKEEDIDKLNSMEEKKIILTYRSETNEFKDSVLFIIESDTVKGENTKLSEDFRDFLRRNGIKFFTDDNFNVMLPVNFEKLIRM